MENPPEKKATRHGSEDYRLRLEKTEAAVNFLSETSEKMVFPIDREHAFCFVQMVFAYLGEQASNARIHTGPSEEYSEWCGHDIRREKERFFCRKCKTEFFPEYSSTFQAGQRLLEILQRDGPHGK